MRHQSNAAHLLRRNHHVSQQLAGLVVLDVLQDEGLLHLHKVPASLNARQVQLPVLEQVGLNRLALVDLGQLLQRVLLLLDLLLAEDLVHHYGEDRQSC